MSVAENTVLVEKRSVKCNISVIKGLKSRLKCLEYTCLEDPFSLIQIDNRWKAFIKQFE